MTGRHSTGNEPDQGDENLGHLSPETIRKVIDAFAGLQDAEDAKMVGMPGKILPGAEPEDPNAWRPEVKVVHIETENFQAEAIPLYLMPAMRVMDAMMAPENVKMVKMFDLFKLSLNDPSKVDDIGVLTFQEFNQVVATWLGKSNEMEEEEFEARKARGAVSNAEEAGRATDEPE